MRDSDATTLLRRAFDAAVASADPERILADRLRALSLERPSGRCIVVGAGKAAASMARAVETAWDDVALEGAVVVPHGYASRPCRRIAVLEAGHPRPDENSVAAARRMLSLVGGLTPDDLVLALVSGGGSALLAAPAPGLTLADKQAITRALLRSGASIGEMNLVRRHLSAIKNGALARAAAPARVVTLLISDIPGDHAADIASGPTLPGQGSGADALRILHRYGIAPSRAVEAALLAAVPTNQPIRAEAHMLATPMQALGAAAAVVREAGIVPLILGDALEGESRQLGLTLAGIARSVQEHRLPLPRPCMILSGGETTVTLGDGPAGRGGRNTEALLAFALAAPDRCWALMADTDGIDGDSDAAGAIVTPATIARATAAGLDPRRFLDGHDSYSLFEALGALLRTGPTHTNVNDFRAVLLP